MTIELTENILMKGLEGGVESLTRLRELGIGISVDDFGTGYSSLSHLSTLPIDSLKIDRSFVQNLRGTSRESEIVRAIVALGKSLGKEVIAEGIENSAQLLQLRAIGCEFGQGHHLSQPQPPERADAMLDAIQMRGSRTDPITHRLAATAVYH
jgi:EAL domain-containing protein (putative c-di-GMP-specific phosphodiesterase class I)